MASAKGVCQQHRHQQRKSGGEMWPIGDRSRQKRLLVERWASMSPERQAAQLTALAANPYERTEEWSKRMSALHRERIATRGRGLSSRICPFCKSTYEPTGSSQSYCQQLCYRRARRARSLGVSYEQLLADIQAATCFICGATDRRLYIDHDHTTGAYRGMLCNHCNSGLGKFDDNIEMLRKAIAYLESHAAP